MMIPVLKRKAWDWILPEYFGYLVDWTMSTFHTCIIALLLTSKTKCCDQLKEDLLNYISSLECFLIFLCWRQENKQFVVDTLFFRKCKMTSWGTETHCVGSHSSHKGSFKNPILIPNELSDIETSNLKTVKIPILKICARYKIIFIVSNAKKNYFW